VQCERPYDPQRSRSTSVTMRSHSTTTLLSGKERAMVDYKGIRGYCLVATLLTSLHIIKLRKAMPRGRQVIFS
jgi:hypothetical protein